MSESVHLVTENRRHLSSPGVGGDFPLDDNVIAAFPDGTSVVSADSFGSSAWTCATENAGKLMMEGEFHAMSELHKTMASFVPKPHAWGKMKLPVVDTYFLLTDFIDMSNELPDPVRLCSRLAELHRVSVSPTGKFGFHIPTCHGKFQQHILWDSNWASFFAKLLKDALRLDLETNGPWPELQKVSDRLLAKVVPRLLGILQEGGRDIKPCLIHGDLWEGNIGTTYENNEIYIFDSAAYYAHNEMELGMWRCTRHRINAKIFTRQYLREFPISEPAEEWDDRNRLYCVKMNVIHSAHHKGDIVRQTGYDDVRYLVDKHAPWNDNETSRSVIHEIED
ncbi:MAG: hypothetical protein Q9160_003406 [Pyrenula sp. 1 TL-2023]